MRMWLRKKSLVVVANILMLMGMLVCCIDAVLVAHYYDYKAPMLLMVLGWFGTGISWIGLIIRISQLCISPSGLAFLLVGFVLFPVMIPYWIVACLIEKKKAKPPPVSSADAE